MKTNKTPQLNISTPLPGNPVPWKSLFLVILCAALILSTILEYQKVQAQDASASRYVSDWTTIPAGKSIVFTHGLHTGPLELDVWVWNTLIQDEFDPLYVPYEYFGNQIQVVKVSSVEIIVANSSHRPITVRVVAKP